MKNEFPHCRIVCVEPDPENFESLRQNLSSYSNMYFENCGIWSQPATLKVYDKYRSGKWGMVTEVDPSGNIPVISIGYLMKKYQFDHIHILKLDIEAKKLCSANIMKHGCPG